MKRITPPFMSKTSVDLSSFHCISINCLKHILNSRNNNYIHSRLNISKCNWYFNIYWKCMWIFWFWPRESEVQLNKPQFIAYYFEWLFLLLLIKFWTPADQFPPLISAICLFYSSPWRLSEVRSNTDRRILIFLYFRNSTMVSDRTHSLYLRVMRLMYA
jgi:hypothetical protein